MNVSMNAIVVIFMISCVNVNALAAERYNYIDDLREIALQSCLDNNYEKIGAYKRRDLHDASFWVYPYGKEDTASMETMMKLDGYITKQTGNFFMENVSVKSEGDAAPQNAIFARCMGFYKSKELRLFVKNLLTPGK